MTANGAEKRFWVYFDTTNQYRDARRLRAGDGATARCFVQFSNNGQIYVYTDRAGNPTGYTTANYTLGRHLRDRLDRVPHRLRLHGTVPDLHAVQARERRPTAWTPLKAAGATGYAIPFRGANTITTTHGLLFRAYQNANLWLDDVRYSDSGITRRRHHAAHRAAPRSSPSTTPPTRAARSTCPGRPPPTTSA